MPNTLIHLGIGGIVSRFVVRGADFLWIYTGAVLPDVPWIVQRLIPTLHAGVDPYSLRLYCAIQASLLFSILLAAAISVLARNAWRTAIILTIGVTLHLLIDATQIKWGNGVQLLTPISWDMLRWDLFWPNSLLTLAFTGVCMCYVLVHWRETLTPTLPVFRLSSSGVILATTFVAIYALSPIMLVPQAEAANSHFVKTLRERDKRPGQWIEFDRERYVEKDGRSFVVTYAGEPIEVVPVAGKPQSTISLRGTFVEKSRIELIEHRFHSPWFRDGATTVGLSIVLLIWSKICFSALRSRASAAHPSE